MTIDEMIDYWLKREDEYTKNPPKNTSFVERMIPLQWVYRLTMMKMEIILNKEKYIKCE